jgi:acetone carboxylase gamma subunit
MTGRKLVHLTDYVEAVEVAGAVELRCMNCGYVLGPGTQNYKLNALLERSSVAELPGVGDPKRYGLDSELELRRYYCPGCAVQFDAELARPEAGILWDIQLDF